MAELLDRDRPGTSHRRKVALRVAPTRPGPPATSIAGAEGFGKPHECGRGWSRIPCPPPGRAVSVADLGRDDRLRFSDRASLHVHGGRAASGPGSASTCTSEPASPTDACRPGPGRRRDGRARGAWGGPCGWELPPHRPRTVRRWTDGSGGPTQPGRAPAEPTTRETYMSATLRLFSHGPHDWRLGWTTIGECGRKKRRAWAPPR